MSITADKFPPITIAELALKILRKTFVSKLGFRPSLSKENLENILRSIESSLMVLKYSYLPLNDLIEHEELESLHKFGLKISTALKPAYSTPSTNQLSLASVKWGVQIFLNLKPRIKFEDFNLGSGVDLKVVHVRSVQNSGNFLLIRAYDNEQTYTIMTIIQNLRPNRNFGAAFLPPREIGGHLSEAMYIGSEERKEEAGVVLSPNLVDLSEVNAKLHQLLLSKI